MFRVAFDPSLPVLASQSFRVGGRAFQAGQVVDWKALGVSVEKLFDWWRAFLVHHPKHGKPLAQPPADISDAELERLTAPTPTAVTAPVERSKRRR